MSQSSLNHRKDSSDFNTPAISDPKNCNSVSVTSSVQLNSYQMEAQQPRLLAEYSCGMLNWNPRWLQSMANKQTFLGVFCLASVLQGIYYTYFVSVLTTIEKLYQIPSRTTGIIMSSTEIGQISGALLLTYYGGQGHRPRWIATGMLVFAGAVLLCSSPHYLFGSELIVNPPSSGDTLRSPLQSASILCNPLNSSTSGSISTDHCNVDSDVIVRRTQMTNFVLAIFFMSLLMIGLGTTTVNTLGIPYIDDNVAPKESALYFSNSFSFRFDYWKLFLSLQA